ncbi:hypothetical protein BACCOP_01494 [Phocaeicola coprocola DSM 17136]|uniref:Uncharacterized protein n=1 Tax=Phocaeicola coprocola DSM 17136 TaxID=470145 RepID=B3JHY1_9BACT|nr:hypothetical protein BACCOP_01494 [Phocaeicola coprocola DSM 17136]
MTISTATTKNNVVKIVFFIFLQILKKRPKDIDFLCISYVIIRFINICYAWVMKKRRVEFWTCMLMN